MAVTLYAKKDFKGDSQSFANNKPNLKESKVGNNPSSARVTDKDEAILLFKKKDYKGGALYIRGPKNVSNLGSKKDGGKFGFGNGVTSLRRTPFTLDLNVSIVQKSNGKLPGDWKSASDAEAGVRGIVDKVNQFYDDQQALLKLKIAHCVLRVSDKKFILGRSPSYSGKWKRTGEIDVVFAHDFNKEGKTGHSNPPLFGQVITVVMMGDYKGGGSHVREPDEVARSLAHELGHHCGIHHASANNNRTNLMYKEGLSHALSDRQLRSDQIQEMHVTLSKNISRKGAR